MIPSDPPVVDDRAIWDLWLSQYLLPVVLAADELGVFALLNERPARLADIGLGMSARGAEALLGALTAAGFAARRQGLFYLTNISRTYLLPGGQFYWVPMLRGVRGQPGADALLELLRTDNLADDDRISRRWERGEMTPDDARGGNQRMQSHSLPAALGLARLVDLSGVSRMLDVAGGSGCFAIAFAQRNPALRCTVAELPVVAADTRGYIERAGCADQVDTVALNMFRDPWPTGYDAAFFSNVFHDWDAARRADLTRHAFAALPPGGRILIHEMLLDDTGAGPLHAALFSIMMLGTRGKQFSLPELDDMLRGAGFVDVQVAPAYGYYSLVSATRPA